MELIATRKSRSLIMSLQSEDKVHNLLIKLRKHHRDTGSHSVRVGIMSIALGESYSLDEHNLRFLGYGGLLHDIGKLEVPAWLLDKSGVLGKEEQMILHEHPRKGYEILAKFYPPEVKHLVVAHHEFKADSYPRSGNDRRKDQRNSSDRRKADVSFLGQLIALADIYDTLSSKRPYKPALPFSQVREIMRNQFTGDDEHLENLIRLYEQHIFKHHN